MRMRSNCIHKRVDGWKVRGVPVLLEDEIFESCCRSDGGFFEPVNSSKNTAVFRFSWRGRDYYLKHYLFENWRKFFRLRMKVKRLPKIASQLRCAGFHTPAIVCTAFRGRQMFSVSEAVDVDCSVNDLYVATADGKVFDLSRLRDAFGREVGRLHDAGFVHGDLRWGNVLVKNAEIGSPEFIYLDNDRTRKYLMLPARGRIGNLVQIHFPEILNSYPGIGWNEFWRGYCAVNSTVRARESYWRKRVECATERRVRKWFKKPDCQERLAERVQKDDA